MEPSDILLARLARINGATCSRGGIQNTGIKNGGFLRGLHCGYPYETTTVSLPAGGAMLLTGTLGDKEVILLITGREAVAVE